MSVTPQGAASLAAWVRAFHPAVYAALAQRAAARSTVGLGDCQQCALGDDGIDFSSVLDSSTEPTTINISTPDPATTDIIASQYPQVVAFDTVNPADLSPVSIPTTDVLPEVTAAPSIGSASTIASNPGVLSNVGSFLASPAGITTLVNLSSAIVQNQTSRNVLTAQVARVSAGLNPAAISYQVNPTTGQVVPYLQSANPAVSYPVTQPLLSSLAPNSAMLQISAFIQQYGLWLGLGLLVVLIARR